MIVLDVNVLIEANRIDAGSHGLVSAWLERALQGPEQVGLPDETLVGFIRLVTNHRVYNQPTAPDDALAFCHAILAAPAAARLSPGTRHWPLFAGLVHDHRLRATDVPDAHLAALTLERSATLATFDGGFARFPGLKLVSPLTT